MSLDSLRVRLEAALFLLSKRTDESGRQLRHDVSNILNVIGLLSAGHGSAISKGQALIERVRIYAEANKLHFGVFSESGTLVVSSESIRQAINAMVPGATQPPQEVQRIIEEEQHISSVPPESRETLDALPDSSDSDTLK